MSCSGFIVTANHFLFLQNDSDVDAEQEIATTTAPHLKEW